MYQNQLYRSLGHYLQSTLLNGELIIQTSEGFLRIIPFKDDLLRISINATGIFDDFSYAVIAKPAPCLLQLYEEEERLILKTDKVELHIHKQPVRLSFYDKEGNVLNEDDPAFGTGWLYQQTCTYKKLREGEHFIGLGEKTGNLDRRGRAYTHWNMDAYGYNNSTDPIYATIPFYIGVHRQLYGIFLDNSHRSHFNFGASNQRTAYFSVEGGDMNYYFIYGKTVPEIIGNYTWLTGRIEMPPLWSLGYQQCRFSYYPDKELINIAQVFRDKEIPCDVLYLDIHYMDAYKIFTWHPSYFPKPKAFVEKLKKMGFKVTVILDPGIKVEKDYPAYESGIEKGMFVQYPDGTPYEGDVWPGWCHFPDFTSAEVREWWADFFKELVETGIKGFWNDMNEIATFGKKIPELVQFQYEGNPCTLLKAHNIYGLQMARATLEGVKKHLPERPFSLTRAAYAGIQRYAAVWTGDNSANEDNMLLGVRLVNSLGISGVPFTGYDIGGYVGDTSKPLFARWITLGAFCPFFRSHTNINTAYSEPWCFGRTTEEIAANYIRLRYRLIPYLYSLFFESTWNGMPPSRSLAIDHPFDEKVYTEAYQNQYLFGPFLLIVPCASDAAYTKVYLPQADSWYNFYDGEEFQSGQERVFPSPLHQLPVFVKAGAIIPMQSLVQNLDQKPEPVLYLHLYAGKSESSFLYYEDDGISYDFQNGEFYKRYLSFQPYQRKLVIYRAEGSFESKFKYIRLIFHHFEDLGRFITVNQVSYKVKKEKISHLKPISRFDPLGHENPVIYAGENIYAITFGNHPEEMQIAW